MDPARIAVLAALLPAAVAAAVLFLLRWRARGSVPPGAAPAASGGVAPAPGVPTWLAVTAAYVAGHLALNGLPRGLPKEAWQTLLPLAVVTGATFAFDRFLQRRFSTKRFHALTLVCCHLAAIQFVRGISWPAALASAFTAAWICGRAPTESDTDDAGAPRRTRAVLAGLAVVAVATAAGLVIAGTLVVGQLAGVLAAALGAACAVSFVVPVDRRGAVAAASVLLPALWMNGVFFAELPWAAVACFVAAVTALRVRVLAARPVTAALAAALLSAAAVWIAKASVPPLDY